MRAVIIGGSGHVGTYLVPRLVEAGFEVISVSRGQSNPYHPHGAWEYVRKVSLDRTEEEQNGTFGKKIAGLKPDIVIDMINFKIESAYQIVEALRGNVRQYLFAGSIWAHGPATVVPATEDLPRHPFGEYGIQKEKIESYLLNEARNNGFPATVVLPGHITGPGWRCINPSGNFDPEVFGKLARGEEIYIPNLGMETVHHVHADDVAQVFMKAIIHWHRAVGENFHAAAPAAMTLRGYAQSVAGWFGKPADIKFLPWEEWKKTVTDESFAKSTWDHIAHSDNYSIEKAKKLIDYQPRYTILQAVYECVTWMVDHGVIKV